MASIESIKELNKIIRDTLIELSNVEPNHVRHALTEYGVDLNKKEGESIFTSITGRDTLILFDITPEETDSNMSEDNNSSIIKYYMYFTSKIIMYGDNSIFDSLALSSKLRSEEVRDNLIAKGIHLSRVSNITKVEEFVNGIIWMRNDFDIKFGCEISIDNTLQPYDIDGYTSLDIYTN